MLDVEALTGLERCVVGAGSPAEGLHLLAEQREAAILVVGVTHRGAFGRIAPGSVGERLLNGAPCPVAAVPAGHVFGPIRTVAVASAGTPESGAALRFAAELARGAGARLVAMSVSEPLVAFTGAGTVLVPGFEGDKLAERLEQDARAAVDGLRGDLDVEAEVRMLVGAPGSAPVAACSDGIDVLVTGSRGYGPARSVLTGTVSRHLVDHAPCPIVVVPRPVAASAAPPSR
jgi:nucleotide-binding universal stress UspA family protein